MPKLLPIDAHVAVLSVLLCVELTGGAWAAAPVDPRHPTWLPGADKVTGPEDEDPSKWREEEVQMPAGGRPSDMQEYYVQTRSGNKFAVSRSSIAIGSDGVVRFVSQVKSPAGGENVVYEGIRCSTRERRSYASWRQDQGWVASRSSTWRFIDTDNRYNSYHYTLWAEHLCSGDLPNPVEAALRSFESSHTPAPDSSLIRLMR